MTSASSINEDNERRVATISPTIFLNSGRYFDFKNPTPLTIEEVAHGLSNICRFTGQCRKFYSVAQHSVLVSLLVPSHLALQGLLHDAAEAVMGDMSGPLKRLFPEYKILEHIVESVVLTGFGLPTKLDPFVKRADLAALATEQRDLLNKESGSWMCLEDIEPYGKCIVPLAPTDAYMLFMARYTELRN